jgi:CubicO group peptidase (beta-lactamase class C family)
MHPILVSILTLALTLFVLPPVESDEASKEAALVKEIESLLERAASAGTFSGAVLVARDGSPIFKKAYGMANREMKIANNLDTKFNLGSMNKMFTSIAIAQLAARGRLSFNDPIAKHLPDYPNKEVAAKVTIHHLLTHTSGLGNYMSEAFFRNRANLKNVADLLPYFVNDALKFEPGARWQYSNAGFVVLGLVVEKLSGQSYDDYVKEHIFKVAGMKDTDSYAGETPNLALSYTRATTDGGRPQPDAPLRPISPFPHKGSPAGGGYSTLGDLLKFDQALRTHKLLSAKYTEIVTTGKVDAPFGKYAYGFGNEIFNGKRFFGHNGGAPGVAAQYDAYPETNYTLIVLGNYDPPAIFPTVEQLRELLNRM